MTTALELMKSLSTTTSGSTSTLLNGVQLTHFSYGSVRIKMEQPITIQVAPELTIKLLDKTQRLVPDAPTRVLVEDTAIEVQT